jgi:hypothetical protein
MILELRFGVTYRAAYGDTRNCQLNALVRTEAIYAACGKKIRCFLGTAKDLK